MGISNFISKVVYLGVKEGQTIEESSRLKIINRFNILCISYSVPYIVFSFSYQFIGPAVVFFIGQLLYLGSLFSNRNGKHNLAKFLILIATNYSVFYLSLYYGFNSGFHLYYFTSPLIVFSLFNFSEITKIIMGMGLYITSVALLVFFKMSNVETYATISDEMQGLLYLINIFLAISFCLLLVTHFSSFNKKMNLSLLENNLELETKQAMLVKENIERRNTEARLQTLLKDKEILLSETHHRVKNNLAVVTGLLDIQMLMSDNSDIKNILSDSRSRIKSMSLIHESLYRYDNVSQIEFGRYINTLVDEIKQSYVSGAFNVKINYILDTVYLPVTKAIPCGLLLNEVVTNAFKHAFIGSNSGEIDIVLKQTNKVCVLEINDNGVGINLENIEASNSIGLTLIDAFVKQLNGKSEMLNLQGTKFKVTFEIE